MARRCKITGKGPIVGNNVSHAHNKTKRRQLPNLQAKRIFVPEYGRFVKLRLSARALRTITRVGLVQWLKANNKTLKEIGG
ncbi:MAG: 50S ribosomal protein L28 [Myxococcota bacterium]|jgi:large subunit ribosomal protein L28|nr:50S ribosomal protein L28 [Myxococcota bacterium]